jgi:hypothetical protein
MNFRALPFVIALSVLIPRTASGQTLVNPDISAIADMRYVYRNDVAAALAAQNNGSFEFEELELAFSGYLNPYMKADLYLGIHGVAGPFELEEGCASVVRGIPVQLKFGKYLLDFGRINTQHPHQWAHGGEGVTDIGGSGRLSIFRSFTENTHVELGGSALAARYDYEHGLDTWLVGGDFKFRWRPDTYRSFNLIAETLYSEREVKHVEDENAEDVTAWGAFSSAELRFRKKYDVGAYADWTQDAYVQDAETTALGGYFGFMPVEETARFSLVYRHEESDLYAGAGDSVTFQVLWSLGPHKPHPF